MAAPGIGTRLGSYRIEALLGRGGMGVVYRATDLRLSRQVALKLLGEHVTADERFRARFLAESRLAASIDHAGIVPIYDAGEEDGHLYIAMRYVDGTDLGALLKDGPLAPERAVALVGQLAEALDAAHARGLVHRDVKPSNALIAREGSAEHVYLADFGLTKHVASTGGLTASDQFVGTVAYLAPERICGEPSDGRADIYALGCVLFECLTGAVPYPRDSDPAALYAHLEDEPPRPSERRPGVPPTLDPVIARALAKDPEQRWHSAVELAGAARAALGPTAPARAARVHAPRRPAPRLLLGLGAVAALLMIVALLLLGRSDQRGGLAIADADTVAVIDPDRRTLIDSVPVGSSPSHVAAGDGALWIPNAGEGTVSRIDARTHAVTQTITVGDGPSAVAIGAGGVWVVNSTDGTLSWISPVTRQEVKEVPAGNGPSGVCVAAGAVWVASTYDRGILRFDPRSGATTTTPLDDPPTQVACGGGSVWATSESAGTVTQLGTKGRGQVIDTIDVGAGASGVAWGLGSLWVANTRDGTVSRIDGATGERSLIPIGARTMPTSVAIGAGGVWVANEGAGTVARIDPAHEKVDKRLPIGNPPRGIAVVGDSLWVAVRASGASRRGGTLRVLSPAGVADAFTVSDFDPARGYRAWDVLPYTNDGLVGFSRAGGRQSVAPVPTLAVSIPAPADGGRTYTFRLRRGMRYSTGATVRASDIRRGLERVLRKGLASDYYTGIRGAARCVGRRARCDLSRGIQVDDAIGTITFRLIRPDPDFVDKLALPNASAVPPGIGIADLRRPLPATGPYMIAEVGTKTLRLVRNPHFRPTAARPDGYPDVISFDYRYKAGRAIEAVQGGRADVVSGDFGLSGALKLLGASATRYAGQLHTTTRPSTSFAFLNTRVAPFNNIDARRAVNYAIDRNAFVALRGGGRFATPTCQFLPVNYPGYRPYCPYTTSAGPGRPWSAPDLQHARRLVARSHTRGMPVRVLSSTVFAAEARLLRDTLDQLGYRATLHVFRTEDAYFDYINDSRNRAQIGPAGWGSDYPSGAGFLRPQFACAAFHPGTPYQNNVAEFCDSRLDRLLERAQRLPRGDARADALLVRADRRLVEQAASVPLINPRGVALVSRRVGNYQYSQEWGVLYDQLWVR